jgi:hypothetical protein
MIGITMKKSFIGIIIWIISITNRPESAHTAKPFTTYRRQPAHLASKIGGFVCQLSGSKNNQHFCKIIKASKLNLFDV